MTEELAEASSKQKGAGQEDPSKGEDLESEPRDVKVPKVASSSIQEEVTQSDTPDVPMRECEKKKVTTCLTRHIFFFLVQLYQLTESKIDLTLS